MVLCKEWLQLQNQRTPADSSISKPASAAGKSDRRLVQLQDHLKQLKAALGSNAIARSELWVDMFTMITVALMVVKVGATRLPWYIHAMTWPQPVSWFAL
jgi:hypothetical protein